MGKTISNFERFLSINTKEVHPKFVNYNSEKCYFGASLNNSFFWTDQTKLLLDWASKNFKSTKVLIPGILNRFNEQILFGLDEEEALIKSIKRGFEMHVKISQELANLNIKNIKLLGWNELINKNEFSFQHQILLSAFDNEREFREEIITISTAFIDRQKHIDIERSSAIDLSVMYILEELAVCSLLINEGYKVQIYPGTQLKVLKDFANGAFNDIDSPLKNGIYIDLTVKKVKS